MKKEAIEQMVKTLTSLSILFETLEPQNIHVFRKGMVVGNKGAIEQMVKTLTSLSI